MHWGAGRLANLPFHEGLFFQVRADQAPPGETYGHPNVSPAVAGARPEFITAPS